jgi:hypothetical protein
MKVLFCTTALSGNAGPSLLEALKARTELPKIQLIDIGPGARGFIDLQAKR